MRCAILLAVASLALAAAPPADARVIGLVSTGTSPATGGASVNAANYMDASTNGDRVVFQTDEPLLGGDTDAFQDVYLRDGATLKLVSSATGTHSTPTAFSGFTEMSADGSRIFYLDNQAVAGNTDSAQDVFAWQDGQPLQLVSGNGGSAMAYDIPFVRLNASGTRAFFFGYDVFDGDTDSAVDTFMWDDATNAITRITPNGAQLDARLSRPSADGTKALFITSQAVAAAGDTDTAEDIYLWEEGVPTPKLLTGTGANIEPSFPRGTTPSLSKLLFSTTQALTGGDGDTHNDAYLVDTATQALTLMSPGATTTGADAAGLSQDGTTAAFDTDAQLVPDDDDTSSDVYTFDGTTVELASGGTANVDAEFRAISTDGSRVTFLTSEALAGTGDVDTRPDVYVAHAGTIALATAGTQNTYLYSDFPRVSPDGTRVAFETSEPLAGTGDADTARDVFLWTAGAGTELVSFTCTTGDQASLEDLSADGGRVYFSTNGQVPGTGDADPKHDVYVSRPGTAPLSQDCDPANDDDGVGDTDESGNGGAGVPPPPPPQGPPSQRTPTQPKPVTLPRDIVDPLRLSGPSTLPVSGGAATVTITNPNHVAAPATLELHGLRTGRLASASATARYGRARVTVKARSTTKVRVKLTRPARKLVDRRRRVKARLTVKVRRLTTRRTVTLRRR